MIGAYLGIVLFLTVPLLVFGIVLKFGLKLKRSAMLKVLAGLAVVMVAAYAVQSLIYGTYSLAAAALLLAVTVIVIGQARREWRRIND